MPTPKLLIFSLSHLYFVTFCDPFLPPTKAALDTWADAPQGGDQPPLPPELQSHVSQCSGPLPPVTAHVSPGPNWALLFLQSQRSLPCSHSGATTVSAPHAKEPEVCDLPHCLTHPPLSHGPDGSVFSVLSASLPPSAFTFIRHTVPALTTPHLGSRTHGYLVPSLPFSSIPPHRPPLHPHSSSPIVGGGGGTPGSDSTLVPHLLSESVKLLEPRERPSALTGSPWSRAWALLCLPRKHATHSGSTS